MNSRGMCSAVQRCSEKELNISIVQGVGAIATLYVHHEDYWGKYRRCNESYSVINKNISQELPSASALRSSWGAVCARAKEENSRNYNLSSISSHNIRRLLVILSEP